MTHILQLTHVMTIAQYVHVAEVVGVIMFLLLLAVSQDGPLTANTLLACLLGGIISGAGWVVTVPAFLLAVMLDRWRVWRRRGDGSAHQETPNG